MGICGSSTVYVFEEMLGEGFSCKVYSAHKGKKRFAIKKMSKKEADNESLWKNERNVLIKLRHRNIVNLAEAYEDGDSFYLVTSFCQGGELFDRVAKGKFSEKNAAELTRMMIAAVQHCHERSIVHRDLKPENFVFETRASSSPMKLIDFGCAKEAKDNEYIRDVAGSAYYVAPEVLANDPKLTGGVWKCADMWSIGVIAYLLLHGVPPFNGENTHQIYDKIRGGRYHISRRLNLSDAAKDFIKRLIVLDPKKRMTASQALAHPWISGGQASSAPLPENVVDSLKAFQTQCRLKKAVARALAHRMTKRDEEELERVFKRFDVNGDGELSPEEIALMMKTIGATEGSAQEVFHQIDENKDGAISLEEFKIMHMQGRLGQEKQMERAFKLFDLDGNGVVSHDEIVKVCDFLTPQQVRELIKEVDKNGDGQVDFKEWVAAMQDLASRAK